MFSKTFLVLFLSLALSGFANAGPVFNKDACSSVASTVTVTVPAAAATGGTLATVGGGKGRNNAAGGAAAGNNKGGFGGFGAGNNAAKGATANAGKGATANTGKGAAANTGKVAAADANAAKGAGATANTGKTGAAANTGKTGAAATANTGNNGNGNAAANAGNNAAGGNAQTSLTLDPKVIATGFAKDGQDVPAAGQVASATSTNNFINFCLLHPDKQITNGQQIKEGSCNPAPMGIIAAQTNIPSAKFQSPANLATVKANTAFTISLAIKHLETGHFTNAQETYFSAPQVVNAAGDIQGHSHVVVEQIPSLTSTTPQDPTKFAFFKGLNDAAKGGVLTADVTNGLPAGSYRACTINSASNHQPALVAVAQHGSIDDCVYWSVTADGKAAGNAAAGGAAAAAAGTGNAAAGTGNAAAGTGNANAGGNANKGNAGKGGAAGTGKAATGKGATAAATGKGATAAAAGGKGATAAAAGGKAATGKGKRWFF